MTVVADFLPALMITFFSVSCTTAACPTTGGGVASTTVRSSFVFSVATILIFNSHSDLSLSHSTVQILHSPLVGCRCHCCMKTGTDKLKEGQRFPCLRHLAFSFSVFFSD